MKFLNKEQRKELSIDIINKLVEMGIVKDCTDTNDDTEFDAQDAVYDILKKHKI